LVYKRLPKSVKPITADRYAEWINTIPAGVIVFDEEDQIVFVNPSAETFFSTSAQQLRLMSIEELFGPNSAVGGLFQQARLTSMPIAEFDVQIMLPRAGTVQASVTVVPVLEANGNQPNGDMILQFSTTSIAHRIEQQMRRQGAARSTAGMVAVLAHEVRNPLAGIRGAAQIIESSVSGEERELTQLIADEVDRISNLIERIDVFAEIGPAPEKPVNIHEALARARRVLESSGALAELNFQEAFDPSLPLVRGDFEGLVQIFLNLIKNAADAARIGGKEILIKTAYRHGLRLAADGRREWGALPIEVSVQDNGPGIPKELQSDIFDPFVTTKPGGHGLGLAVVAKIVGDHAGAVEFESEPFRTIFNIHLPLFYEPENRS
jgi:two-component system nitrogen regulation sensor histidine kinase GlnL